MKKLTKLSFALSVAALAASLYSLADAAAYHPVKQESAPSAAVSFEGEEISSSQNSAPPFETKVIKLYNGQIAVFEQRTQALVDVLDTDPDNLPSDAIRRLKQGIIARSEEEYLSYLEDFSGGYAE